MPLLLATLDELRAALDSNATSLDDYVVGLAESVTAMFEGHLNIWFARQAVTEYFDPPKTYQLRPDPSPYSVSTSGLRVRTAPYSLRLNRLPLDTGEAISVYYSTVREFNAQSLLVEDTDYIVEAEKNRIRLLIPMQPVIRSVRVDYTGGYTSTAVAGPPAYDHVSAVIPADLKRAAIIQTTAMFRRSRQGGYGYDQDEGGSMPNSTMALVPEVQGMLARYVRPLVRTI